MSFAKCSLAALLTLEGLAVIVAARPAFAQTEKVLYRFPNSGLDCKQFLSSLASDGKGNFYGTTSGGGTFGVGTVFELSPNGGNGEKLWKEIVLYSFTGGRMEDVRFTPT